MYNPNTLGKFLRLRRKELKLTLEDVGIECGLTTSAISHIERGTFHSPSEFNLEKLGAFYRIPTIDLAKMIDVPSHKTKEYINDHE